MEHRERSNGRVGSGHPVPLHREEAWKPPACRVTHRYEQRPLLHVPEVQSEPAPHGLPVLHAGAHAGGWHVPATQIREPQSAAAPQPLPSLQAGAQNAVPHLPLLQKPEPQSPLAPQ